jgi:hypothetical protein
MFLKIIDWKAIPRFRIQHEPKFAHNKNPRKHHRHIIISTKTPQLTLTKKEEPKSLPINNTDKTKLRPRYNHPNRYSFKAENIRA